VTVILRHDVDQAYVPELRFGTMARRFVVAMNWYREYGVLGCSVPGIRTFGYLCATERLFEFEKSLGIRGSWFFRKRTRPAREIRDAMTSHGCEVSFHADRVKSEHEFLKDLTDTLGDVHLNGFTKHGNASNESEASLKRIEVYDAANCLDLSKKHRFRYFSGNGTDPDEPWRIVDGLIYFPSAFWIFPGYMNDSKYTLDWLVRNQKEREIVVLIHPREYTDLFPGLKQKIDQLVSRVDEIMSFSEFIKLH
jgi:hypothetical protein